MIDWLMHGSVIFMCMGGILLNSRYDVYGKIDVQKIGSVINLLQGFENLTLLYVSYIE